MACTLVVTPHENIEKTIMRWSKISDLLTEERELVRKIKGLKGFETEKREKLKSEIKKNRGGDLQSALKSSLDSTFFNINNISMTDRQTDRQRHISITKTVFQS